MLPEKGVLSSAVINVVALPIRWMTSSTKPEVHKVLHFGKRRIESRPRAICTEVWTCVSWDKQSNRHAQRNYIYILLLAGAKKWLYGFDRILLLCTNQATKSSDPDGTFWSSQPGAVECRGIQPPPPPPLQCGRASQSVDHLFAKKRKKSVGENLVSERETLDDEARSILADAAARRGCHASIAVKTPLEWLD